MRNRIVAAIKNQMMKWANFMGKTIKLLLEPARIPTDAIHEATRSRGEPMAKNALLRQQLIVACRKINRPPLRDSDRVFVVLLG